MADLSSTENRTASGNQADTSGYVYIEVDEDFRLMLIKYLEYYFNYNNFEENTWAHVPGEEYKEPTLYGFLSYLKQHGQRSDMVATDQEAKNRPSNPPSNNRID